jgi:hypothetical protein
MTTYKNRYGDVFTFTEDDDNNILWEGDFEYCRIGYPNDYTKAYNAYVADGGKLSFNEFKSVVHESDEHNKYNRLVESFTHKIDMVDPSGGPYISAGMDLRHYGYTGYKVKQFEPIKNGYKIITNKCNGCHKPGAIHKMSCPTQKATVFMTDEVKAYYDQMDKEVHQNKSNLNQ